MKRGIVFVILLLVLSLSFMLQVRSPFITDTETESFKFGSTDIYSSPDLIVLDSFEIAGMPMKSAIHLRFDYYPISNQFNLFLDIFIFPDEPYSIEYEIIEFYGELKSIDVTMDGVKLQMSLDRMLFIGYDRSIDDTFNYILCRFNYYGTAEEAFSDFGYKEIDLAISFQFDVLSDYTTFSPSREIILLGTTPVSTYSTTISMVSYELSSIIRVGIIVGTIALLFAILYFEYPRQSRKTKTDSIKLHFLSSIYPHMFVFLGLFLLGPKQFDREEINWSYYTLLALFFVIFPSILDIVMKNFYYDGIYTQKKHINANLQSGYFDRSALPNTLVQNTRLSNGEILGLYEKKLFRSLFWRSIITIVFVLLFGMMIGGHQNFGILYLIWVFKWRVTIDLEDKKVKNPYGQFS